MSIEILKSRIHRHRELLAREMFTDDSSDDARVKIKPEFKEIHQTMMKHRLKMTFTVRNTYPKKFGSNPILDELKDDIADWCNANCTGYWSKSFKMTMIEEEDPMSGRMIFKDIVEWNYVLSFEVEADLERFMKEQALLTKLKF